MKGGALCFIYVFKIVVQMCVAVCTRECVHMHVERPPMNLMPTPYVLSSSSELGSFNSLTLTN